MPATIIPTMRYADAAGMIVIELDMALPGPARAKEGSDAAG